MDQTNTFSAQTTSNDVESEQTAEDRLAAIQAALTARLSGSEEVAPAKAKLAPFTCPMDPAERAACDSCQ